ncbi:GAF and ANTAR domain-containing protein [Mycolicibacterium mengxianglii]|uniref:GAF and ANTAR domain-containing protein n=1 Tax=Mycolicibacterium mengxianglii TaxID=2736649 RepID=UPI0018EF0AED|nr:GAF and ANTAR domain-containing protein [Mycolicibacterium mengxianglii]
MDGEHPRNVLARRLGDIAVEFQSKRDAESTLQAIVEGAVAVVPGARWAGISLIHGRSVEARVPSDPLVAELDTLQSQFDDGPCLDALRDHHTVLIDDMAAESRWPRFTQAAVARGVGSLLSFQLFVQEENLGALNLYAGVAGAFSDDSVVVGELLAQHASVALAGSAATAQLSSAVASRDIIGQAKGILMYRENLSGTDAFTLMVETSKATNIKVVDIARWLVEEHEAGLHRP